MTEQRVAAARALNEIAEERGQTLAQMAIQWLLNDERVTSVILGASSVRQIEDNMKCIEGGEFTREELQRIENIISQDGLML